MKNIIRLYPFLLTFCFYFNLSMSQSLICVQGKGSTPVFVTKFSDAISVANSGDFIYLPGGNISTTGSIVINKRLNIIGCGYHKDSSKATGITILTSTLILDTGSGGSFITGLSMDQSVLTVESSNITISRCKIYSLKIVQVFNPIVNLLVSESIVVDEVNGNATNFTLSNNILGGRLFTNKVKATNNVFLANGSGIYVNYASNSEFYNNVFYQNNSSFLNHSSTTNNTIMNNMFVVDSASALANSINSFGNKFNLNQSTLFKNYDGNSVWSYSYNFGLPNSSVGLNAGTDGSDIGIYGGNFPFKDGGNPLNPRFLNVLIPSATNKSGVLEIKVKVQGQDR